MREEMWRLYRHLIIGGVIIVAACYAVMEFTQIRFGTSRTEQLLCVDAELSAALLLSGIDSELSESRFNWTVKPTKQYDLDQIIQLLGQQKLVKVS